MNIRIVDNINLVTAANIAITNRLFVNGWDLRNVLGHIVRYEDPWATSFTILFAYDDEKPVGILLTELREDKDNKHHCQFFVRKAYRRKGIGTLLFNSLKKKLSLDLLYADDSGAKGCTKFFNSLDLKIDNS